MLKRYFYIQSMITRRKEELTRQFNYKYWGLDFNLNAEIANDTEISNLYKDLEKCISSRDWDKSLNQKLYNYHGKKKTLYQLSKESLVGYNNLKNRVLYLNWSIEKALETSIRNYKKEYKSYPQS